MGHSRTSPARFSLRAKSSSAEQAFVTILFVGTIQIAMMGILGIYIGKTFEETKGRPLYLVKDTANFGISLERQDGKL